MRGKKSIADRLSWRKPLRYNNIIHTPARAHCARHVHGILSIRVTSADDDDDRDDDLCATRRDRYARDPDRPGPARRGARRPDF